MHFSGKGHCMVKQHGTHSETEAQLMRASLRQLLPHVQHSLLKAQGN